MKEYSSKLLNLNNCIMYGGRYTYLIHHKTYLNNKINIIKESTTNK